ncbi:hypothetical protein ACFO3H_20990 [Halorussus sp. GCM10023401]|nr:hypothetical protein NGM07_20580 [Halorussus vallis]
MLAVVLLTEDASLPHLCVFASVAFVSFLLQLFSLPLVLGVFPESAFAAFPGPTLRIFGPVLLLVVCTLSYLAATYLAYRDEFRRFRRGFLA